MGEIFSQIITNTESVDVALGLDVTLSNQIEIWATMSISSVAVIYFAHLLASLRAAFVALFGKNENSNNNNNNIPPPSWGKLRWARSIWLRTLGVGRLRERERDVVYSKVGGM